MTRKGIEWTHKMFGEYRNTLQDMACALEDCVDYSEIPAYAGSDMAETLWKAMRDMEELHRQFRTALKNGDL